KQYHMRPAVAAIAKQLTLPRFYSKIANANPLFHESEWELLNHESLLQDFKLSTKASDINFDAFKTELFKVDLEEVRSGDYAPKFIPIEDSTVKDPLVEYILARPPKERLANIADMFVRLIDDMWPIPEQEIRKYVARVIEDMSPDQLQDILIRKFNYSRAFKEKITLLSEQHAEEKFGKMLNAGTIKMVHDYKLANAIIPGKLGADISNSLYEREGDMNTFESTLIASIAGFSNVAFWHRNLGRGKGFAINGFKNNHYPDFIIVTQGGTIILLETKGSFLDNPDTQAKVRLGKEWKSLAGSNYRYFMVYEGKAIPGALSIEEVKEAIRQL
ncbi:MAG: hypothetical protein ABI169_03590, partial [Chitinophagaceae bacterium]